jgi:GT2 family glycosyltransferase
MKISVIIPTRNRINDLVRCLQSLITQSTKPDEILVIDSSNVPIISEQKFQDITTQLNKNNIELIYKHTAPGLTYQRNIGTSLAHGNIIYFFDDDVVLEPDYIQHMQQIFKQYPHYYGGMGTIKNPSTALSINRLLRILFLMQRENGSGVFTFSGMPTHAYGKKQFQEVTVIGGCGMVYRTEIFKQHQFDETLGKYSYMEDCDFSKRISRTHKLFYNPAARLDHFKSPLNRDHIAQNRAQFIRNYSYLFFKNFYPENRLRIFGYCWTITGLFIEASVLIRNIEYIRGYIHGLQDFYSKSTAK